MESRERPERDSERGRSPYHEPRLRVYADLRSLTEARSSKTGKSDGAYGNYLKTG